MQIEIKTEEIGLQVEVSTDVRDDSKLERKMQTLLKAI